MGGGFRDIPLYNAPLYNGRGIFLQKPPPPSSGETSSESGKGAGDAALLSKIFFTDCGLEVEKVSQITGDALKGADDGELFLEYRRSELLAMNDGRLTEASFDSAHGFGLRAVAGEATGYAHGSEISHEALARAGATVRAVCKGRSGILAPPPPGTNMRLYGSENPLEETSFEEKVALLSQMDAYARGRDRRVKQTAISLAGSWQAVSIVRADGHIAQDIRPLARLNVRLIVEKDGRSEAGVYGMGFRAPYEALLKDDLWKSVADEALRQALVNLEAVAAPAGAMDVVLGSGWPGILLHEAIGHGLEGDFHRRKSSAFTGLEGTRVAAEGITIVDDGTLEGRRGSLTIDDEGTPSQRTILIEDGILRSCLQDRMNARLMGVSATGNGRRESYAHAPMPRMTNTFMLGGDRAHEEIIASVKKGIYAPFFGGGQVDITSGKFVFSCTEAYEIEGGKIGRPLKNAMLIGNGPDVLKRVTMVGDNMALDSGIGTCGKDGQSVPVGVGQPTLLIENLTVGGTES